MQLHTPLNTPLSLSAPQVEALGPEFVARVEYTSKDLVEDSVAAAGPFDLILSGSVLTFVPDVNDCLAALKSRLNPGGQQIHFCFHRDADKPGPQPPHDAYFNDGFSTEELDQALKKSGFRTLRS